VQLIDSSGGVFDVTMDGQLLYSKKALKRHVEPGEVVGLARKALG
jgi:hypothetical protein